MDTSEQLIKLEKKTRRLYENLDINEAADCAKTILEIAGDCTKVDTSVFSSLLTAATALSIAGLPEYAIAAEQKIIDFYFNLRIDSIGVADTCPEANLCFVKSLAALTDQSNGTDFLITDVNAASYFKEAFSYCFAKNEITGDLALTFLDTFSNKARLLYAKQDYYQAYDLEKIIIEIHESLEILSLQDLVQVYSDHALTCSKIKKPVEARVSLAKAVYRLSESPEREFGYKLKKLMEIIQEYSPLVDQLSSSSESMISDHDISREQSASASLTISEETFLRTIFVSSTFKDMQFERDMLQSEVLPEMRKQASEIGEDVSLIDLRWGVSTSGLDEDESAKKVLEVCFDEIDKSRPYLVCFIGNRYGWIPPINVLMQYVDPIYRNRLLSILKNDEEFSLDDLSVTAMEIFYAAFTATDEAPRVLFCIRDEGEDGIVNNPPLEEAKHLQLLKRRIEEKYNDRVIHYKSVRNRTDSRPELLTIEGIPMASAIQEKLIELFQDEWDAKRSLTGYQKQKMQFDARKHRLLEGFVEQDDQLNWLDSIETSIKNKEFSVYVIKGADSSGKSTMLSALCDRFINLSGYRTILFFSGLNNASQLTNSFYKYIVEAFRENGVQVKTGKISDPKVLYEHSLNEASKLTDRFIVFLDSFDRLVDNHNGLSALIPADKIEDVVFVVTGDAKTSSMPDSQITHIEFIPQLKNIQPLANSILSLNHKELARPQLEELNNKCLYQENPILYMRLVIARLTMLNQSALSKLNSSEDIDAFLFHLIEKSPNTIEGLIDKIIEDIGQAINTQFATRVLGLLSLADLDLTKGDIEGVFGILGWDWNELEFVRLVNVLSSIIEQNASGHIRLIAKSSYRNKGLEKHIKDQLIAGLFSWLFFGNKNDVLRKSEMPRLMMETANPLLIFSLTACWDNIRTDLSDLETGITADLRTDYGNRMVELLETKEFDPLPRKSLSFWVWYAQCLYTSNRSREIETAGNIAPAILACLERAQKLGTNFDYLKARISELQKRILTTSEKNIGTAPIVNELTKTDRDVNPKEYIELMRELGTAYEREGDDRNAERVLLEASSFASQLAMSKNDPSLSLAYAKTAIDLAGFCFNHGRFEKSLDFCNIAIQELENNEKTDEQGFADGPLANAYFKKACILLDIYGKDSESTPQFQNAAYYSEKALRSGLDHSVFLHDVFMRSSLQLANYYYKRGESNLFERWAITVFDEGEIIFDLDPSKSRANRMDSSIRSLMDKAKKLGISHLQQYEKRWRAHVDQTNLYGSDNLSKIPLCDLRDPVMAHLDRFVVLDRLKAPEFINVQYEGIVADMIFNRACGYRVYRTQDLQILYSLDIDYRLNGLMTGDVLQVTNYYDAGIQYLLTHGFPQKQFKKDDAKSFLITQTAIWCYLYNVSVTELMRKYGKHDLYNTLDIVEQLVVKANDVSEAFKRLSKEMQVNSITGNRNSICRVYERGDNKHERLVLLNDNNNESREMHGFWRSEANEYDPVVVVTSVGNSSKIQIGK